MVMQALLTVGRVSNLPTVWTNVLAAAIIAQSELVASQLVWFMTFLALSLMYLGGMFLNDAFDAPWDKLNNPSRPIAAGQISASLVWVLGIGMMLIAVVLIGIFYLPQANTLLGWLAALSLAACIVLYNAWHKTFAHAAFIMGGCRFGVYVVAALLLAEPNIMVILAAFSLLLYIAGLTYLARLEHVNQIGGYWPLILLFSPVLVSVFVGFDDWFYWLYLLGFVGWVVTRLRFILVSEQVNVKACIGGLLAAIPLFDGLMLASVGAYWPSMICLLVFLIIPKLHRWVSGT